MKYGGTMNTANPGYQFGGLARQNSLLPPMSPFSAFNLLRNCNYFLESPGQDSHLKALREVPSENTNETKVHDFQLFSIIENERGCRSLKPKHIFSQDALLPYSHSLQLIQTDPMRSRLSLETVVSPSLTTCNLKKQRSEKRPIPEEQKDDKYFERRRRNNQAAKKSRDARKIREDQIALRATILEHENAILRAQVATLREEAASLRQMLIHRKQFEVPTREPQLCVFTP